MKIISNVKDYYDYVSGQYGIDDLIVFDRRNVYFPDKDESLPFYTGVLPDDLPYEKAKERRLTGYSIFNFYIRYNYLLISIGFVDHQLEYFRYLDETGQPALEINSHISYRREVPISALPINIDANPGFKYVKEDGGNIRKERIYRYHSLWYTETSKQTHDPEAIPVLGKTVLPSIIPAHEVWTLIYEHLSALKEKPFNDTRSDIQKLQSAGFDKRTSFRNM